ncbi:hypothetical protein EJD97_002362 [Solanum chilense]|uniref:Uncharacterized protein n=1 Tax=Solanum chilense TaxID=4083 RepID=A0A6N2C377_SOLCI|nr:hypothetical protein EJD97_002362 [Solanum chilense]
MAQNPKHPLKNMTLPLLQENGQSFRHPPPRPPPPATATPSKTPLNCVPIQSTNSTSSSSSAFDQFSKRVTRDLPNLSDCHGCGVRINHTDPDDRLLTLDSFWRIVLLCKKCIKCVDSGQTCPYCFKNTDDTDCSKCRSCKRQVHKDCVSRYGNSAPWSFCSRVEGGLFVCIDCWVPNFFKKSIGDCRKIQKDVLKIQHCSSDFKSSEKIAKHANLEGFRKEVVVGLKAKNSTLQKAVVAKNPMGLAKSALESVVKKGKSKGKVVSKDVNDAQLAFQLHRSMNSSPRISKTLGPKNSSYVGGPEIQTLPSSTGERLKVYSRTKYRGKVGPTSPETPPSVMVYSRTRLKEKVDQTTSETSPRVTVYSRRRLKEEVGKASSDASPCLLVYSRSRFKEKVCQTDSEAPPCVTTNECGSCVDSACSKAELLTYKRNKLKRKTCDEKVVFTEDRYLLKYSRRKRCWKPGSDVHEDTFPQPTPDHSMPSNCCHSI